eukprot:RCo020741
MMDSRFSMETGQRFPIASIPLAAFLLLVVFVGYHELFEGPRKSTGRTPRSTGPRVIAASPQLPVAVSPNRTHGFDLCVAPSPGALYNTPHCRDRNPPFAHLSGGQGPGVFIVGNCSSPHRTWSPCLDRARTQGWEVSVAGQPCVRAVCGPYETWFTQVKPVALPDTASSAPPSSPGSAASVPWSLFSFLVDSTSWMSFRRAGVLPMTNHLLEELAADP